MPSGCGGTALHEETPATKPSSSARAPLHLPYMHPSSCSHAPCTILCEQGDGAERHADPRGGEGRGGAARGAAELSRQGFGGHARRTRERPRGTPERCAARAAAAPQVGRAAEPQSHLPRVTACDVGPGLAPGVAARTKSRAMAAVWRSLQGLGWPIRLRWGLRLAAPPLAWWPRGGGTSRSAPCDAPCNQLTHRVTLWRAGTA